VLESARTRENRRQAREAREQSVEEGEAFRAVRRAANVRTAAAKPGTDAQGLVEFECECVRSDCERTVRVPLYVYKRMLDAGDQYLLHTGHHASSRYRTIVSFGVTSIEEET
jgi:hypothetical protein